MKMRSAMAVLLILFASLISTRSLFAVEDRAADAAALKALDERWSAAAAKMDVAAMVAFYAQDAVLLAPNVPIATDAKSIRESWAGLLVPGATVSWKVTKAEVAKSGELGYLYGTYKVSQDDAQDGAPTLDTGKLVEVWKKQG